MFIEVRYGHNETLICNPYCVVVNLLTSIKERVGFKQQHNMVLDLSDETGLVKDLDLHRMENADKYLTTQGPYILVEKQVVNNSSRDEVDSGNSLLPPTPTEPEYQYVPLLDGFEDLFPEYKLRVTQEKKVKQKPRRESIGSAKSASPAGRKVKKKPAKKKLI